MNGLEVNLRSANLDVKASRYSYGEHSTDFWHRLAIPVALGGLSIAVGAGSTTSYGLAIILALIGLGILIAAIAWFDRDPVGVFLGVWLLEVVQAPLSAAVGYHTSTGATVRQSSDVLVAFMLGLAIWRSLSRSHQTSMLRFAVPGILIIAFGILSSLMNHVSPAVTLQGMWLGVKFWTLLAVAVLLPWQKSDAKRIYGTLMMSGIFVAFFGLVDYFGHGLVAATLHTNSPTTSIGGYRLNAVQSVLSFPGEFSLFMSLMAAVAAAYYMSRRRQIDLWLFLLYAISIFLSLRLKGVLSIGAIVLVVALCSRRSGRSNFVPAVLLGLLLTVFAFSFEGSVISRQASSYLSSEGTTARADLYGVGTRIAKDHFPFGVGFGRYASDTSRTHYSTVYDEYGLSGIYGLDRSYPNYIDDTSWPSVMGETGYAGFISFTIGLILLTIALYRRFRLSVHGLEWLPLAGLCVIAVMVVDSLGDPTFFEWRTVTAAALILGPALVIIKLKAPAPNEQR